MKKMIALASACALGCCFLTACNMGTTDDNGGGATTTTTASAAGGQITTSATDNTLSTSGESTPAR